MPCDMSLVVRVTLSLVLFVCFVDRCLSFDLFIVAIVLSVLLLYTDSDYTFDILKLFLQRDGKSLQSDNTSFVSYVCCLIERISLLI
jgi:hypothetical protein